MPSLHGRLHDFLGARAGYVPTPKPPRARIPFTDTNGELIYISTLHVTRILGRPSGTEIDVNGLLIRVHDNVHDVAALINHALARSQHTAGRRRSFA